MHAEARSRVRPSAVGGLALVSVFAFWLAAANYSSSSAYLFFFLLCGLLLGAWLEARRSVLDVEWQSFRYDPAFAGEEVFWHLTLRSGVRRQRRVAIALEASTGRCGHWSVVNLPVSQTVEATVALHDVVRGVHRLQAVWLAASDRFGFFVARRRFVRGDGFLVYPHPAGMLPLPALGALEHGVPGVSGLGGDDFTGLRRPRPGESPRHLDWKGAARGRPLLAKEFSGGGMEALRLKLQTLAGIPLEVALSQLTRWVVEADGLGAVFTLELGAVPVGPGVGSDHTQACLAALAMHGVAT